MRLPCCMRNFSESISHETTRKTIVCMKWGYKYSAEYVNILYRMAKRHCRINHRFACLTDDARGLDDCIDVLPLRTHPLPRRPDTEAWRKLQLFDAANGLSGTCLFLDLDVVITDAIDSFFECDGDFLIIKNWTHDDRRVGNSSVMRFVAGAHPNVFANFIRDPDLVATTHRNEQIYLSHEIDAMTGLSWWPEPWCRSYKKHCLASALRKLLSTPTLPAGCRILVFHGNPNPRDAARNWFYRTDKRFRLPKAGRPAPWILNYWR